MTDFTESSLFMPSAPSEYLIKKPKRKKIKVDENQLKHNKKDAAALDRHKGPRLPGLITSRQRITNNYRNNSSRRGVKTNNGGSISRPPRRSHTVKESLRLRLISKREREPLTTSHNVDATLSLSSSTEETPSQNSHPSGNSLTTEPGNPAAQPHPSSTTQSILPSPPADVIPEDVVCTQEHQHSQICSSQDTHSLGSEGKTADHINVNSDPSPLSAPEQCEDGQKQWSGKDTGPSVLNIQSVNVSDIQERFTKMNLKRCEKDPILLKNNAHNLAVSNTFRETLGDFPMTGKTEVDQFSSVCLSLADTEVNPVHKPHNNASVIDTSIPPRETLADVSNNSSFIPVYECNKKTKINQSKRHKIIRLVRYLLELRWRRHSKKEDKQLLVEEEVTAEEDGPEQGAPHDRTRWPLSQRGPVVAKKRRRPRKKNVYRAGRRVCRSLGRGCRYLGHGLANMTSMVPEAAYMGPVTPTRGYDCEFITSDYM